MRAPAKGTPVRPLAAAAAAVAAILLAAAPAARAQQVYPLPDVRVAGVDFAGGYLPGEAIPAQIALDCGTLCGEEADWWIWAQLPGGRILRYDGAAAAWVENTGPDIDAPAFQQPLSRLPLVALPGRLALPSGTTLVYFALDQPADGVRDPGGDASWSDDPVYVWVDEGFYEDFNDGRADGWRHDALGRWSVERGRYVLRPAGSLAVNLATYRAGFWDFIYGADVRCVAGDANTLRRGMGLVFRAGMNYDNGYTFHINARGYFTIFKRYAGRTTMISNWRFSDAIRRGFGRWNRLEVVAVADTIEFRVNDVIVRRVWESTFSGGRAGVKAFGNAASGDRFEFDNAILRVWSGE